MSALFATAGTATGLGPLGRVEMGASSDDDNIYLREIGYRIARKYVGKLRTIAAVLGLTASMLALAMAQVVPAGALAHTPTDMGVRLLTVRRLK